jgi:hypothetical protein
MTSKLGCCFLAVPYIFLYQSFAQISFFGNVAIGDQHELIPLLIEVVKEQQKQIEILLKKRH